MITCPDKAEDILVNGGACTASCSSKPAPAAADKTVKLDNHLVSERSVADVCQAGATRIVVGAKAIVTDLAKEYAQNHNVELVRE